MMSFGYPLGDGQTQSNASLFLSLSKIHLVVSVEDMVTYILRHSDTCITHYQKDL